MELKSTPLNTLDYMLCRDIDLVKFVTAISLSQTLTINITAFAQEPSELYGVGKTVLYVVDD